MNHLRRHSSADDPVDLSSVFPPKCVENIAPDTDKASVITQLISSLAKAGRLPRGEVAPLADALLERERVGTTGMGKGLAFPHMRTRAVDEFVGAIGIALSGVDFESLDGQPTRLVILLLSPFELREQHGVVMGRLATLMSNSTLQYSVQVRRNPETLVRFLGFRE